MCLRYEPFVPIDGGVGRACRGASASDNSGGYYQLHEGTVSLQACQDLCSSELRCKGVEYSTNGRCEVWTREGGIASSVAINSNSIWCLRFEPFLLADGGLDRACRGRDANHYETSFFELHSSQEALSLEDCKSLCVGSLAGCKGVSYGSSGCEVWTRIEGIGATVPMVGSVCLRHGQSDLWTSPDAFPAVDGGDGRACRGNTVDDNDPSNYVKFFKSEVGTLEKCKSLCMRTRSCKGMEFSDYGCELWTLAGGIRASVPALGFTCLHYLPFVGVDGGSDRSCRGAAAADIAPAYYTWYGSSAVPSAESCQDLCISEPGCRGIEFSSSGCKVWTRVGGIETSVYAVGYVCLRYEPFSAVDCATDKSCRGAHADDLWPSYYTSYDSGQGGTNSLNSCKAMCVGTVGCKGIDYGVGGCRVWTKREGIGAATSQSGSWCLRFGAWDPAASADAFVPVDTGAGRACVGSGSYLAHGPAKVPSLESCKSLCVAALQCRAIEFGRGGCKVWTSSGEVTGSVSEVGSTCLRYDPFRDVDGGVGRACCGADAADTSPANYFQIQALSLQACQDACANRGASGCKGISFYSPGNACRVWIRPGGIEASIPVAGSTCQRFEPFMAADAGVDRACRGKNASDISTSYYQLYGTGLAASNLEFCRSECVGTPGCKGLELSPSGCKVWLPGHDIGVTSPVKDSWCLRFGPPSLATLAEFADVFKPLDGGVGRSCRGANTSDRLTSYFETRSLADAPTLEACKALCIAKPACKGVGYNRYRCELWTRPAGIQASVAPTESGYYCFSYQPFELVDGFDGRECRGADVNDNDGSHYSVQSRAAAPTLEDCKALCARTFGCKGVEFNPWSCELWTLAGGIRASVPATGFTCLVYQPFLKVDGGLDRSCRGADANDDWPSYYQIHDHAAAPSLDACKALCIGASGCTGIDYSFEQCKLWSRGIGLTVAKPGALCLRFGDWDPLAMPDAFSSVDGGEGRACRGANPADTSTDYYTSYGPEKATSVEICKLLCLKKPDCSGIEWSPDGCKVWTRPGGIMSSAESLGATCLRYEPFQPIDGGQNRACRGADSSDNSLSHFVLHDIVSSVTDCKALCREAVGCKGIGYSSAGCQVWMRDAGIGASFAQLGSVCFRFEPFVAVDGAEGQSCRGVSPDDNSPSYYLLKSIGEVPSLNACRAACVNVAGCQGLEFSKLGCKVWTRAEGIEATSPATDSVCLRYVQSDTLVFDSADAFKPADGGIGRACRGANVGDNLASYHTSFPVSQAPTMDACKNICMGITGCKGIELSQYGCEIWIRPGGINATVAASGYSCLRYEPFTLVNGFRDQACRGASVSDNLGSYFNVPVASSLDSCRALCIGTLNCKGVEYIPGRCEVWTQSIGAIVSAAGFQCERYLPFTSVGSERDSACRGADPSDSWNSYHLQYEAGQPQTDSLDSCKLACAGTAGCKGIEYSGERCEVWTRREGIGSSQTVKGSVCLRFGQYDLAATADSFEAADGGVGRSCRGGSDSDAPDGGDFVAFGPAKAGSLEQCKSLCLLSPDCRGVEFSAAGCQVWTRAAGIGATVASSGATCMHFEAFSPVDGGVNRACRGSDVNDAAANYFVQHASASLAACKALCVEAAAACKAISFSSSTQSCQVWTRTQGVGASTAQSGSTCLRYEPFIGADGGKDRSCRGANVSDDSTSYYVMYDETQVTSLQACKTLCVNTAGCKGVDFSPAGCKVWTGPSGGIRVTQPTVGSICLRYGQPDPAEDAEAFKPADGGIGRACRGANTSDNLPSYFSLFPTAEVATLDACKNLCVSTPSCKGVEFSLWGCEIWTRAGGVAASVSVPGFTCLRYEPFELVDGFDGRACRGADVNDNNGSHYSVHSRAVAPTLEDCKALCARTFGCKGVEFNPWSCELWTLAGGIRASVPATGFSCLVYQPFLKVDGGLDRSCRGADANDDWPSYYQIHDHAAAPSLDACKALCIGASGCTGIDYSFEQCKLWSRGIGLTVAKPGALCLRFGDWDPLAMPDAFSSVDGGEGRACRGANPADTSTDYYTSYGPEKATSVEICKLLCFKKPDCSGIEWSPDGCKVWTRPGGIMSSAESLGATCLRYEPFQPIDGGQNRACRGADSSDNSLSHFVLHDIVSSVTDCKALCREAVGCKGIGYSSAGCQVWMRDAGIGASFAQLGSVCFRFEPFVAVDGAEGQSCRGVSPDDNSPSYYLLKSIGEVPSLDACKAACVNVAGCQGLEFSKLGCKVWTRAEGIEATSPATDSVCLRYVQSETLVFDSADAFKPADGGIGRACRGASVEDNLASYHTSFPVSQAPTMEACKNICMGITGCKGIELSQYGCEIWIRPGGINATVAASGYSCLRYEPFTLVNGFRDQACRGASVSDNLGSYFNVPVASSLDSCRALCIGTLNCKGVEYIPGRCEVWTQSIGAIVSAAGFQCERYLPFTSVGSERDSACRGADPSDSWNSYHLQYEAGQPQTDSLDSCKLACAGTAGCKGIEYSGERCEVWTRREGIGSSQTVKGSVCLRFGQYDLAATADSFEAADGGVGRSCRGGSDSDAPDGGDFVAFGPAKAGSLEQCKSLCLLSPDCRGVEFSAAGCQVWTRAAGIGATVASSGATCMHFEAFSPVDGGVNRACRGSDVNDAADNYFVQHASASLAACKALCVEAAAACKAISFSSSTQSCQVWTRTQGVGASTAQSGSTCLRYEPFIGADGGKDRSCRGANVSDDSTSYYVMYDETQVTSLQACKTLCVNTAGCKGVDFSPAGCKVWTGPSGGIRATQPTVGSICLRYGQPDPAEDAEAFKPADGGIGRACRGANTSDNLPSYFSLFPTAEVATLDACKNLCVSTPSCKGVEFSLWGCEIWTRAGGVAASVSVPGFTCLRYEPFELVDGFTDRACRGTDVNDNSMSNFQVHGSDKAPSLDACQMLCIGMYGCKGIEYTPGRCELWSPPGGIRAVFPATGFQCSRYLPFLAVDGGAGRSCRGADASDNWASYYESYGPASGQVDSLDACKAACLTSDGCKGIDFRLNDYCKVWTRPAGIGSSAASGGSICLRFGPYSLAATADSFVAADGGADRSCRGASPDDTSEDYYTWYGPEKAGTLEACKTLCVATPDCQAVEFSSAGCQVWTREGGIGGTAAQADTTCLRYEPFQPVDGGSDRGCRGADASDAADSYYTLLDTSQVPTLESCKIRCAGTAQCKGVSFSSSGCQVWTRPCGIFASVPTPGSSCLRYEPFVVADGGKDRSCRGVNSADTGPSYYRRYSTSQARSLAACRALCVGTHGCVGLDYNSTSCLVWTRAEGVGATAVVSGSLCLRYGPPDPLQTADVFEPADGGRDRACRGASKTDNSASNWLDFTLSEAPTLEACKLRCVWTPGCTGVEFKPHGCEVWIRRDGIGATVVASGYQCWRYKPFRSADGFNGRACRGADADDFDPSYYTWFSPTKAPYQADCQILCAEEPNCKGIDYSSHGCKVWTRSAGIQATRPLNGYSCLLYEPFTNVDGGIDRACRGLDASDNHPAHYTIHSTTSVQTCKALCIGTAGCQGLEYSYGRCEVWTRLRGVGGSVDLTGSLCLRYKSWDPSDIIDSFLPADGGAGRACRGADKTDKNQGYYAYYLLDVSPTFDACKAICTITPGCKGVQFSRFGCQVWTRNAGIEATASAEGYQCFRYDAFAPINGGVGVACRGADAGDISTNYYSFHSPSEANFLEVCQALCVANPGCKGISYSAEGCEIWTRSLGIQATYPKAGASCFRHEPFTAADGGKDRACRGAQPWDNSAEHYRLVSLSVAPSLATCKALCIGSPGCRGIEFSEEGCKIWTRPGGIDATATSRGSTCLRYGATQAGAIEVGQLLGPIHLASDPSFCLDITGGSTANGTPVRLSACVNSPSQQFLMMNDSTAQIRWASHPEKCLDVAGGQNANGASIEIWDCQTPVSRNMQFLLPDSGIGQVRWATHLHMCLDVGSGGSMRLWSCMQALSSRLVLPAGQALAVRQTKYVAHYMPWFLGSNVDEACARAGDACPYKNSHWCSSYGNSYYSSFLGTYDLTNQYVIDAQLDIMKSAGLDGLWIDYQTSSWDSVVDRLIAGLEARGMGFAIMVDSATFPNVMADTAAKLAAWTQQPHYYRHQGLPIVPVWNTNETIFTPLPVNAIYISRFEVHPPEWASDTYSWVQHAYLERYYELDHPVVSSGSAFRGYRDCYINKTLLAPNVLVSG
ncbi:unnamed protein product [Polarella glacialis]|uniref:Apple domain-containing protein n=1 Tax=Polarella glacialis TaxID=89957 RepID=A0A813GTU9_POLGL|nr:unnamed protein product [Polarella glacialis]